MDIKKIAALIMTASLAAALSAGCHNHNKNGVSDEEMFPTSNAEEVSPIGSTELKGEIGSMAMEIAGKVIEREISEKDHEKLIDEFIANVGKA